MKVGEGVKVVQVITWCVVDYGVDRSNIEVTVTQNSIVGSTSVSGSQLKLGVNEEIYCKYIAYWVTC